MTDKEPAAPWWRSEDWAAVFVGLALIALVFVGAIPAGVVP